MSYYFKAFKNYANACGRATRKEYWLFALFHYIIIFALSFLDVILGFYSTEIPLDYGYMTLVYMFVSACPSICLKVRRLHDVGKSGLWWWGERIPLLNLYVFYLTLKPSEPSINAYGIPSNYKPTTYNYDINANNAIIPNQSEINEPQQNDCFVICVYDDTDKAVRKIQKVMDVNKFPPSKFANNGMYYAIDRVKDDKKVRTYYTKETWESLIENPLTAKDSNPGFCINCGYTLVNGSDFCSQCGTKIVPKNVDEIK